MQNVSIHAKRAPVRHRATHARTRSFTSTTNAWTIATQFLAPTPTAPITNAWIASQDAEGALATAWISAQSAWRHTTSKWRLTYALKTVASDTLGTTVTSPTHSAANAALFARTARLSTSV